MEVARNFILELKWRCNRQKSFSLCLAVVTCLQCLKNDPDHFVSTKMVRNIRKYLIFNYCATNALGD